MLSFNFDFFRFVRYKPGGVFAPHEDNCYARSSKDRSFWTVNIYLNDVYTKNGGATRFIENVEVSGIKKGSSNFSDTTNKTNMCVLCLKFFL